MATTHLVPRQVKVDVSPSSIGKLGGRTVRPSAAHRASLLVAHVRAAVDAPGGEFHMWLPTIRGSPQRCHPPAEFAYTFDNIAAVMTPTSPRLCTPEQIHALHMAGIWPVRSASRDGLARADRVEALIVQNRRRPTTRASARLWETRRAFWLSRAAHEAALRAKPALARGDPDAARWTRPHIPRSTIRICGLTSTPT
jgi:hypothetical protein